MITREAKVLEVRRKFIAIQSRDDPWEKVDYQAMVWSYQAGNITVRHPDPKGYYPGLLVCYVNGEKVDYHRFDQELREAGLAITRDGIMKAINR